MKFIFCVAALIAVFCSTEAKLAHPKVQVYSFKPGKFGEPNVLMCYVTGFHPPDISIHLLKNGVEIPNAKQTNLAFKAGWDFHLMNNVDFTPMKDDMYLCRVRHHGVTKDYNWQSSM